jgi:hypothetical protein
MTSNGSVRIEAHLKLGRCSILHHISQYVGLLALRSDLLGESSRIESKSSIPSIVHAQTARVVNDMSSIARSFNHHLTKI